VSGKNVNNNTKFFLLSKFILKKINKLIMLLLYGYMSIY